MQKVLMAVAIALGCFFAYVDTRPNWDDTGVMVVALFAVSAVFGFLGPKRPWLWALALGVWIPLFEIFRTHNYGALIALVVALVGAYGGMAVRAWLSPVRP